MMIAILKFVGKEFLKKYWHEILMLLVLYYVCIGLMMYTIFQYAFWYKYDCKPQMELYEVDANSTEEGKKCDENGEVLTYEVVEEKDVIDIGQAIYDAREETLNKPELIDPHAIKFLDKYEVEDKSVHNRGTGYRLLTPQQADGFYNTPYQNGGNYTPSTGGRVYHPSNTLETYWQWAQDVSAATGWHPLFILAQWTQEVGAKFNSNNFRKNNNLAGQTWHSGLPESMKGTPRPSAEGGWYIRYDDAVDGYIDFIKKNPRYNQVPTFSTPEEQAAEVKRQGWATDPDYVSKITTIIQRYRKQFGDPGVIGSASTSSAIKGTTATILENAELTGGEVSAPTLGAKIVEIATNYYNEMGKVAPEADRVTFELSGGVLEKGGKANSSDFTKTVYKEADVDIENTIEKQMFTEFTGEFIDGMENLAPGDLIFFENIGPIASSEHTYKGKNVSLSHVGIYIGNGDFLHLSEGKGTIDKDTLDSATYKEVFVAGKRFGDVEEEAFEMDMGEGDINEAEIHLRALEQADIYALEALELNDDILESDEYKDTKIAKTWLVAKHIKKLGEEGKTEPYASIAKRAKEAEDNDDAQSWVDRNMNWLLYVQYEAYKCYMVGDNDPEFTFFGFFQWLAGVFGLGDKPCQTLDELYQDAGGEGEFIPSKDRNQLEQQHVIIEDHWECVSSGSSPKKWGEDDDDKNNNKYYGPGEPPTCPPKQYPIVVRNHQSYDTHQQVIDILYAFEPYAMHEVDKTVDEKDMSYPDLIKYIVGSAAGNMANGGIQGMPSSQWIVPMEDGTYNFSSGFGNRVINGSTEFHLGVDMGTQRVPRVPVYATADGEVISVKRNDYGLGGVVMIDHKNGYYSLYGHFWVDDIVVKEGQQVVQAQLLGGAGNDMFGDAWHLHFEICKQVRDLKNGVKLCGQQEDPQKFITGLSTKQNVELTKKRANQFTGAKDYSGEDEKWNKMKQRAAREIILMPGYTRGTGELEAGGGFLGDWVKKNESGDKGPAAYWDDPVGGNSLGVFQFSERQSGGGKGSLYGFGDYLKANYADYYHKLSPYDPTSDEFVKRWIALANADPNGFTAAQHAYAQQSHYDPVARRVLEVAGFDPNTRSRGIREAIWSGAIQYPAYMPGIIKEAIGKQDVNSMSDADLIKKIYEVKIKLVPQHFASSSANTRASIVKRYKQEMQDILDNMVKCGC